jgi:signal transduction histidine kinase
LPPPTPGSTFLKRHDEPFRPTLADAGRLVLESGIGAVEVSPGGADEMNTTGSREAEFMGRITASATHELRNVLAIVKESAGLVEDLVKASETRGPPDAARLLKATGRIEAQVARGAELVTRLNRFAHSLDQDIRSVDLDEEVRQVAFLSQRFARKKLQTVHVEAGDGVVPFQGSSLHVQMALFSAVELFLDQLPEGGVLTLRAGGRDGRAAARLAGTAGDGATLPGLHDLAGWPELKEGLADLGFSAEASPEGYEVLLLFDGGG